MFKYLVILLAVIGETAWADTFVFDPSVTPTAGYYIPLGPGHYNYVGASQGFSDQTAFIGWPDVQVELLSFIQGKVPEVPSSVLPCLNPGMQAGVTVCDNVPQFFVAGSSTALTGFFEGSWIDDSAGNPLALMLIACGGNTICQMQLFSGVHRTTLDLSVSPQPFRDMLVNFPRVVYTGGVQDIIEAHFYDGSVDQFEIGSVPEPSYTVPLCIFLIGVVAAVKLRQRVRSLNVPTYEDASVGPVTSDS